MNFLSVRRDTNDRALRDVDTVQYSTSCWSDARQARERCTKSKRLIDNAVEVGKICELLEVKRSIMVGEGFV